MSQVFAATKDNLETEELMRDACTDLGSLAGICVKPLDGIEARSLPRNSFSLGEYPTLLTAAMNATDYLWCV